MIQIALECNGEQVEIKDIKNAEMKEEMQSWRYRVFDALLLTPCPVCKTASKATVVLISEEGKQRTKIHSPCHQEFEDSLEKLLPKYLAS